LPPPLLIDEELDWNWRGSDNMKGVDNVIESELTHQSVIKTTFLLYFATPAGMTAACDAMGAVSIIGLWKPYV
jgi:hypothetical protein